MTIFKNIKIRHTGLL